MSPISVALKPPTIRITRTHNPSDCHRSRQTSQATGNQAGNYVYRLSFDLSDFDPDTAVLEPFTAVSTLSLICNVVDPITRLPYSRDPRYIARKAETYLKATGLGDTCYFGPEPEFFILDDIRYGQNQHEGYYFLDSEEGQWNTGRDEKPNLGYKPR